MLLSENCLSMPVLATTSDLAKEFYSRQVECVVQKLDFIALCLGQAKYNYKVTLSGSQNSSSEV